MKRMIEIICAAIVVSACALGASAQINTNNSRTQPSARLAAPKISKLDSKAMTARVVADETPRVAPKPAAPNSTTLLLALKSLGLSGAPQPGEYVTLTSATPSVAGRGYIYARHVYVDASNGSMKCTSSTAVCDITYRLKPAAAGQSYLVDITVHTMDPNTQFDVDNGNTIVGFEQPGEQHILLTFTASDTAWRDILISSHKPSVWIAWSCKVTLIK